VQSFLIDTFVWLKGHNHSEQTHPFAEHTHSFIRDWLFSDTSIPLEWAKLFRIDTSIHIPLLMWD